VISGWPSEQAMPAHAGASQVQRASSRLPGLLACPMDLRLYRRVDRCRPADGLAVSCHGLLTEAIHDAFRFVIVSGLLDLAHGPAAQPASPSCPMASQPCSSTGHLPPQAILVQRSGKGEFAATPPTGCRDSSRVCRHKLNATKHFGVHPRPGDRDRPSPLAASAWGLLRTFPVGNNRASAESREPPAGSPADRHSEGVSR
jgi:hypothetical protein